MGYASRKAKAMGSKVFDPMAGIDIPKDANVIVAWRKNDEVKKTIDTSEKYFNTMKDIFGKYDFFIEKYGDKVKVTVEGTPYRDFIMTKQQAFWEWDMIWNKIGCPKVLLNICSSIKQ